MTGSLIATLAFALALAPLWQSVPAAAAEPVVLADPSVAIEEAWVHKTSGDPTEYTQVTFDGRAAIRASGQGSASGLFRDVTYGVSERPWLEWSWRVERLQASADIRIKDGHDFAACIFLIFGRKSLLRRNPLTLGYGWTSARIAEDEMVVSPYHRGKTRMFVVRSGTERLGEWVRERRNVVEDFRAAFSRDPPDTVEVLEIFTDSDQTGQSVETYYGAIRAKSHSPDAPTSNGVVAGFL